MNSTAIERALCCGPTCGRSKPGQGECVAITHGRRQLMALEAAGYVVEQGWQPIETAPRDGTEVLVYATMPDYLQWADPEKQLRAVTRVTAWHPDGGWCVDELREALHWRPLPGGTGMTDRMALLEAVAEAARQFFGKWDRGAHANPENVRDALAALRATPPDPVGETVEVWGAVRTDLRGYAEGRVFQFEKDARRMAGEWGRTENGPIIGMVFTARAPLPTIPTVAATVER
jgi:hypothetical protein